MPSKFLTQTSHTSSRIQHKVQDNQTFTLLMNQQLLSSCSSTVNFAKLTTLSSVLTAAIMWSLRHVMAVTCMLWSLTTVECVWTECADGLKNIALKACYGCRRHAQARCLRPSSAFAHVWSHVTAAVTTLLWKDVSSSGYLHLQLHVSCVRVQSRTCEIRKVCGRICRIRSPYISCDSSLSKARTPLHL